jgi:phospholipid/cholesterol/gamma-HCH transport system permease protein
VSGSHGPAAATRGADANQGALLLAVIRGVPTATHHEIERDGDTAVVHVEGDVVVATARAFYDQVRAAVRGRGVRTIELDFAHAGRVDSAGAAVVSLMSRQASRDGKRIALAGLATQHRAVLAIDHEPVRAPDLPHAGALERLGARVEDGAAGARAFAGLCADAARESAAVAVRERRLPAGSTVDQLARMGIGALFIVGLLSVLLGMTTAFQGSLQLKRFGASPFVADLVSVSMVRELAPLLTAILLAGRTGAAISAELATMHLRSEIDALQTMGIEPVRFLILPRLAAITIAGPGLALYAMFMGIAGAMLVAGSTASLPAIAFWHRVTGSVELSDFVHGLTKSLAFAWIIGLVACHTGLRAGRDASSVGSATTRTVVTCVFLVIVTDALFTTTASYLGWP